MEPEFASVDHLSHEAVASFVDNELPQVAMQRAYKHLEQCPECRLEVHRQLKAAEVLRSSTMNVHISQDLMSKLCSLTPANCPTQEHASRFRELLDALTRRDSHKR